MFAYLCRYGTAIALKDVGYLQVGYDQRRSTVDLDGAGEVVGGIVVMEQDQNVLAVTRALTRKLDELRPALPAGVEIVATYDRSAWIWATLRQFFETLGIELVVLIVVTLLFLRNLRTAIGPIAILLFSVLFTALPLVGFRQTLNLFSLAGLAIAIGEIADATIVIVENCTAELSHRGPVSPLERQEILVRSIASVTKPLLFSLLIILASFLPVFFLEQREARLFDPLAYSKTFAMAFSTLLTMLLLPLIVLWIFKHDTVARQDPAFGLRADEARLAFRVANWPALERDAAHSQRLTRAGAASSKWNPSLATRAMISAVVPPHGNDSPTASKRPVRATDASTVSVSSGLTVRRSTTSISNPSRANSAATVNDSCTITL
jgi:Cu/Ag efflux pump CusA